ncbi:MAG: SUMF1/EgtB/PvdO family nonheme iron enzyme [Verrucomicrobiae bacterium]|nr:SUMF1/EgtB/PvdO family nonheme iron enzyme [Verrucomicrobiae bacterium]
MKRLRAVTKRSFDVASAARAAAQLFLTHLSASQMKFPVFARRSFATILMLSCFEGAAGPSRFTNSIGMVFVQVPPGVFQMGNSEAGGDRDKCFDEAPAHQVTLTRPFWIGATEVTLEQYRLFRPGFDGNTNFAPAAAGISWRDAVAFCDWLSQREGIPYRLPTEAEWEYAARRAEELGIGGMLQDPLEWCYDWHGPYTPEPKTNPVGRATGFARVVRGGRLDDTTKRGTPAEYRHVTHRAGIAPAFGVDPKSSGEFGRHHIGFRVVQAPFYSTPPLPAEPSFVTQCVRQDTSRAHIGPPPDKPYFRKRYLLPVPPDNSPRAAIDAAGFPPSFRGHNHSPALTVCPNGDVLLVIYTSYTEYESEVSLIATRLRFGADEWDFPSPFVDFPGANDHAPLLFTDGQTVRLFWGCPELTSAFPFQWIESKDNGATWSEVRFPRFVGPVGPHDRQPINTAFRSLTGTIFVASDAKGPSSVLWASDDNGATWYDPGGRSAGRHTVFAPLGDGAILGLGGKDSNIDGYMPQVISRDGGRTWERSKTIFPAKGTNQRPGLRRLASGRLLFVGDFQDIRGRQPEGMTNRGSFVALSDDDGKTWRIKKLPGAQPHENPARRGGEATLGYAAVAQAPNGMIHLVTSMNHPCLHFEFNEAWILSDAPWPDTDAELMGSTATQIRRVEVIEERYPNGALRAVWRGGVADDGRWLLHGLQTAWHPDGKKQWEACFELGRKTGRETFWDCTGRKLWEWEHGQGGRSVWRQFWPNGRLKAESMWRDFKCEGTARRWGPQGNLVGRWTFVSGSIVTNRLERVPDRPGP